MESRIDTLEIRYAHLEKMVEELSHVVWSQGREIANLKELVKHLREKSNESMGLVDANQTERPPHY